MRNTVGRRPPSHRLQSMKQVGAGCSDSHTCSDQSQRIFDGGAKSLMSNLFPPLRTILILMLFQRWAETVTWAVSADLLCLRPKRAFLRFRLFLAQRRTHFSFKKGDYDAAYKWGGRALQIAAHVGEYPAKDIALFFCHQFIGFVCCHREEWDESSDHLIASVNIKGNSILRILLSYLGLPRHLINKGYIQSVLLYLDYLSDWWCCGAPLDQELCEQRVRAVNKWKRKVRQGLAPTEYPWPQK